MLAVTVLVLACLCDTSPAIRSICFSISPPKTFPAGLASDGNILTVISAFDSFGLFGGRTIGCQRLGGEFMSCSSLSLCLLTSLAWIHHMSTASHPSHRFHYQQICLNQFLSFCTKP